MAVGTGNVAGARQALARLPLDGFIALAEMMGNPEKREEFVAEIREITRDLNMTIERVGKASEIERLAREAKSDRESAAQNLADATTQAKATTDAANAAAKTLRRSLEDDKAVLDRAIQEFSTERERIEAELNVRDENLKRGEEELIRDRGLQKKQSDENIRMSKQLKARLDGINAAATADIE